MMRYRKGKLLAVLLGLSLCTGCGTITSVQNGSGVQKSADVKTVRAELPKNSDDEEERERWQEKEKNLDMKTFYEQTLQQFLAQGKEENTVYSPLNVYLALSMLAEIGAGETQSELLHLLQAKDTGMLKEHVRALWNANYEDSSSAVSLLANSIWLDQRIGYNEKLLQALAKDYHASAFSGVMGSDEMDKKLQDWLNESTRNLLKDYAGNVKTHPDTVLKLLSTIYFKSAWTDNFSEENTSSESFHGKSGDREVQMMHRSSLTSIYRTKKFTGLSLGLSSGTMHFILPSKDVPLSEIITDHDVMDMIGVSSKEEQEKGDEEHRIYAEVNMSIPKFRLQSKINLLSGLKALGVEQALDPDHADFKKLCQADYDGGNVYVSEAEHAAMVMIDEEGVTGAAYTDLGLCGAAMPEETIDFILDRPFYYVITSEDNSILFAGTAYDIQEN